MFKETCLVGPRRTAGTHRRFGPWSPQKMAPAQRYLSWSNTCNQSIKCNKHVLYECTKRKREWSWEFWCKNHWIWSCGWKDMNFWSFGAIFGDFSEARDLFGIIFQFSGPNCKNPGPRVNFGKPRGPECKTGKIWTAGWLHKSPVTSLQDFRNIPK
jgi:hypothetical protein